MVTFEEEFEREVGNSKKEGNLIENVENLSKFEEEKKSLYDYNFQKSQSSEEFWQKRQSINFERQGSIVDEIMSNVKLQKADFSSNLEKVEEEKPFVKENTSLPWLAKKKY